MSDGRGGRIESEVEVDARLPLTLLLPVFPLYVTSEYYSRSKLDPSSRRVSLHHDAA